MNGREARAGESARGEGPEIAPGNIRPRSIHPCGLVEIRRKRGPELRPDEHHEQGDGHRDGGVTAGE
jgi:hypothetical protein